MAIYLDPSTLQAYGGQPSQPQQSKKSKGGFNLGQLLSELTYLPRGAAGAVYEVGRAGASLIPGIGDKAYTQTKNPFLSIEELTKMKKDPVKEAAKLFASGASFAVPFGKGASLGAGIANPLLRGALGMTTKAVLPGAVAGGAQAFSADRDVVGGAIAGGATAGALRGGGNLLKGALSSTGKVGQALQSSVVSPFVRPSATAAKTEAELTKDSSKLFGKFSSGQGMRDRSARLFDEVQQKINVQLPKINKKLDFYDDVLPKLYEKFDDTIDQT